MNERIRELLVQSGLLINASEYRVNELDPNIKKFAELILQECLVLFENAKVNQEDDVDYGLEEAKNIIKEHFGVEE